MKLTPRVPFSTRRHGARLASQKCPATASREVNATNNRMLTNGRLDARYYHLLYAVARPGRQPFAIDDKSDAR